MMWPNVVNWGRFCEEMTEQVWTPSHKWDFSTVDYEGTCIRLTTTYLINQNFDCTNILNFICRIYRCLINECPGDFVSFLKDIKWYAKQVLITWRVLRVVFFNAPSTLVNSLILFPHLLTNDIWASLSSADGQHHILRKFQWDLIYN